MNGVNRIATKDKKILLTTVKRGKKYRLATKKLTEIYRQPTAERSKILTDNRQSNEILTDKQHVDPSPLPFRPLFEDITKTGYEERRTANGGLGTSVQR